jgi:Undecaprenyl-phosphate galactose phosphotransferase WbaP
MAQQEFTRSGFSAPSAFAPTFVDRLGSACFEVVVAWLLFIADVAALVGAFVFSVGTPNIAALAGAPPRLAIWLSQPTSSHLLLYIVSMTFVLLSFCGQGLYSRRLPFWEELAQYIKRIGYGAAFEFALLYFLSESAVAHATVIFTWLLALLAGATLRAMTRKLLSLLPWWYRPVIIVGAGDNAFAAYDALRQDDSLGYRVTAFVSDDDGARPIDKVLDLKIPIFRLAEAGPFLARAGRTVQIVLALDSLEGKDRLFRKLLATRPRVLIAPPLRGFPVQGMEVLPLFGGDVHLMGVRNNLSRLPARFIKRFVDVLVATFLLITLFAPVFLVVWLQIRREDRGPILFRHRRVGRFGREIQVLKFRTMILDAEAQLERWSKERPDLWAAFWRGGSKLKNDPRILTAGHWLRSTSLDEIPQLINVLLGEMSLVGPRPIVAKEVPIYGPELELYKQVRPGLTGLWQVSGRSQMTFPQRSNLDAWYVRNWSIWYDVVILIRTPWALITRSGAY